jgi:hypothetical protein
VERSRARERWILDHQLSWKLSGASSFGFFHKSFFSFSFLVLRPIVRVANGRLCLIGVAALSCVGRFAPRTSSYPDSWDETQRPLCLSCMTAATGESVPSNARAGLRPTSSSHGQDSPDRKFFTEIHHTLWDGNQNCSVQG